MIFQNPNSNALGTVSHGEKASVQQHTKRALIFPLVGDVLMYKSLYLCTLLPIEQHATLYLLKWGQIVMALRNLTKSLFFPSAFGKQGDGIKEERIPT